LSPAYTLLPAPHPPSRRVNWLVVGYIFVFTLTVIWVILQATKMIINMKNHENFRSAKAQRHLDHVAAAAGIESGSMGEEKEKN
jgi:hypothetical protein